MSAKESNDEYTASLQNEINRVKQDMSALQSEFNNLAESDDDNITPEVARKALVASAPSAIQQIISLAVHADSDSVRLNASKYIVDVALGKVQIGDPADDAFNKLLNNLTGTPKPAKKKKAGEHAGEGML